MGKIPAEIGEDKTSENKKGENGVLHEALGVRRKA